MYGVDDFKNPDLWSQLTEEEKDEIAKQMPTNCVKWMRPVVQFLILIFKIPLQLYFVTYQVNKVWTNEEDDGPYHIPTTIVYYIEFVAVTLFFLATFLGTFDWIRGKRSDDPAHALENIYTNLFKATRFSLLIIIPFMALRQISTSILSVIRKIYNSSVKMKKNVEKFEFHLLLFNVINMTFLVFILLSWWFLVPCAVIIKLRQMEFIIGDRWFIEWHYDEFIVFFGFLNQLSSMCETVELPQVFLGQFLYSYASLDKEEEEKCPSCNNACCKALKDLLDDEKIIGSILEYGPGVHYIRTKVIEVLYEKYDNSALMALAVLHGLKYRAYCRIFRHRIGQGIQPKPSGIVESPDTEKPIIRRIPRPDVEKQIIP